MDPKGKVVLVTGAAGGMGSAFTRILLQNGANVLLCDVNEDLGNSAVAEHAEEYGEGRVLFKRTDITKEDEFEDAMRMARSHFKRLDIVVNNAGVLDDKRWERSIEANVKGTLRGTLLALRHMGKDHGGDGGMVINIASVAALEFSPALPVYTATKHAVLALSKCFGTPFHHARTGVSVVTLCPGPTVTALGADLPNQVMFPACLSALHEEYQSSTVVMPEVVAKSFLHVVQKARSGSVWVSEGSETYEIELPDRKLLNHRM